ncbi:disease resistance protein Pik-2-like [Eucalyptus grandis]|uniref:disease resistance protein Pik-2-like n=1 Tax=Eucalyptus grandis TaxID=71139 RepID=UPI00192EE7B7|nr:disease resistance protein Pik-2-like [Eucalyptus grandis]
MRLQGRRLGFEWCASVRLTVGMGMQDFLFEILKQMGKLAREVKDMNLHEMTEMHRIELEKKFLIVLDGVRPSNGQLPPRLVSILYHGPGHIIITTQDLIIVHKKILKEARLIELRKLNNKQSQQMLAKKLPGLPDYQSLSKDSILEICRGLPLRISLFSELLPDAEKHERRRDNGAQGSGRDFHSGARGKERDRGGELERDGFPKACYMHTSPNDMICLIAMDMGFLHGHAASKSKDKSDCDPTGQQQRLMAHWRETKVRWLVEHPNIVRDGCGDSCPGLNLGHVHSYLSFYTRRGMLTKDISTFLRNMIPRTACSLLRVLDLEGVCRPSLEGVLHKPALVKYLGLRSTVLHSIPSVVADLHYLETLDIKDTYITSLPYSFWKARNLRHSHLNRLYIDLKNILEDGNALTKLQTLSGLVISEVKESSMMGHMRSLTTLKLFLHQLARDTSGTAGKAVADLIRSRLTNLQSLTLGVTKNAKPVKSQIGPLPKLSLADYHGPFVLYLPDRLNKPIWTQLLPVSLRVLTLSSSRVEADMMTELGGLLRHLRTLRLLANSFLGTSLRFAKDGFPSLMILKIWKLPRLQEVIIEQGATPHLKFLKFRHLDMMKNVEGLNQCGELENFCVVVRKGADGFVDHLKVGEGRGTPLHKREATDTNDEDDRHGTI